jgi:hypothetical protein
MLTAACTGDAGGPAQDSRETTLVSVPASGAAGAPAVTTGQVTGSATVRSSASQSPASQSPVTDAAGLGGSAIDPAQFVSAVGPGFQGVTSISGSVAVDGPAVTEDGSYRGTYRDGKVTGMSVDMTIISHGKLLALTMVAVDNNLYVRSAALVSELHLTKPWLLISANSSNPEIAEIAMTLSAILEGIGPAEYRQFTAAILAASDLGQDTVDGAPAHHVRALVDAAKSVAALDLTVPPSSTEASTPPGGPLPVQVDVWLDDQGRAVTTTTTQTVANQQTVSTNHVTAFNQPVTITAPDPADVATP